MNDRDAAQRIYERIAHLEQRMKTVEHKLEVSSTDVRAIRDDLKRELSRQSEELALTRQAVRIFEDTVRGLDEQIRGMASDSKEILNLFNDHRVADAGNRAKALVGIFTASLTGIGTLGVLAWGLFKGGAG